MNHTMNHTAAIIEAPYEYYHAQFYRWQLMLNPFSLNIQSCSWVQDPAVSRAWGKRVIQDDPKNLKNERGTLTFATSGSNTRTTQLFLNLKDNSFLDNMGFTPLAKCVSGCDILDKIEMKYAEKPNQGTIQQQGNVYLKREFPDLDYIVKATLLL